MIIFLSLQDTNEWFIKEREEKYYLLELLQCHESNLQNYPQLTKKYRLSIIPSIAVESWHVWGFLLKALSASSSVFCLAWWHSKALLAFTKIKSLDHLTFTWTVLHLAKLGTMGFFLLLFSGILWSSSISSNMCFLFIAAPFPVVS